MTNLIIEYKSSRTLLLFGIAAWKEDEYSTPLKLNIKDVEVDIFIEKPSYLTKKRIAQAELTYKFIFKNTTKKFINGIVEKNKTDTNFAIEKIYDAYKEAHQKLESLLRGVGKVENLMLMGSPSREEMFGNTLLGSKLYVYFESNGKKVFSPKLQKSKKINPLFSSKQLITFEKWKNIQIVANKNIPVSPEIDELLKIKAKLLFIDSRKFAVLESIILIEYSLGRYIERHLSLIGLPAKKIKEYGNELTLNLMLNVLLPITLSKTRFSTINRHISNVNNLRKIRNKIMHEKMTNSEIDPLLIKKGIDSSIKLMGLLSK